VKIVFFGTGLLAVPVLERLRASDHQIVGCVTSPDATGGRGLEHREPPVKQCAQAVGLSCQQPARLDAAWTRELTRSAPDVGIVVDYGHKIPSEVLAAPRLGMLGIHPSLLPKYRGPAPIQWAVLSGDEMTGVTVFRVTPAIDAGDILLQDMTAIRPDETAVTLRDRLAAQGAELTVRALELLARGGAQWHSQDDRQATLAPKLTKADGEMHWDHAARILVNRIRGLQPWPGSYTFWQRKLLKLGRAQVAIGCAVAPPGASCPA